MKQRKKYSGKKKVLDFLYTFTLDGRQPKLNLPAEKQNREKNINERKKFRIFTTPSQQTFYLAKLKALQMANFMSLTTSNLSFIG